MASLSAQFTDRSEYGASEMPLVRIIDQWIYVIIAAFFIVIVLVGFIPDSFGMLAAVNAGRQPPIPPIMHVHAVLMGSFLLLLLAQAVLAATGRLQYHQTLGLLAFALIPAIVIAGFILVPTVYHSLIDGLKTAPPPAQAEIRQVIPIVDDIMLLQIRIGVLFPLFVGISLAVRKSDSGLHKRLMFLALAPALAASINRMPWLPTTLPANPLASDLYVLLAVTPMFAWDLYRTRKVHKAYLIWLAGVIPAAVVVSLLWNTAWWHSIAPHLVGA